MSAENVSEGHDEPGGVAVRKNWKRRLGVCGAVALLCMAVLPVLAASAQTATAEFDVQVKVNNGSAGTAPTTTTTVPETTTSGGEGQITIHGHGSDVNACNTVLVPNLQPPGNTNITVTFDTSASPQPHRGDPITLSGTSVTLNIPASL